MYLAVTYLLTSVDRMWVMRIDHASSPLLPVDGDLQQVSDRCSCDGRDIPTEVKARSASPIAAPFRQVESIARDRQMGCPDLRCLILYM